MRACAYGLRFSSALTDTTRRRQRAVIRDMDTHSTTLYERHLTVSDAARYMNCSRWTVYRLIQDGALKPLKVGSRLRFRPSDLDAYMEGRLP